MFETCVILIPLLATELPQLCRQVREVAEAGGQLILSALKSSLWAESSTTQRIFVGV